MLTDPQFNKPKLMILDFYYYVVLRNYVSYNDREFRVKIV